MKDLALDVDKDMTTPKTITEGITQMKQRSESSRKILISTFTDDNTDVITATEKLKIDKGFLNREDSAGIDSKQGGNSKSSGFTSSSCTPSSAMDETKDKVERLDVKAVSQALAVSDANRKLKARRSITQGGNIDRLQAIKEADIETS